MSRGARWAVVSACGVAMFTITWWVAETVFALDRGTAQAFAGLAVALATVPAGWWFALDPPAARRQAPRADQDLRPGQQPVVPVDRSGPRTTWPTVLTVGVVVLVCLAGIELWQNAQRHGNRSGNDPVTANQSPTAQSVAVNKSLWYEGMKITVGNVTYNPARDAVVAELRLQNLSNKGYDLYFFDVSLKVANQFVGGGLSEINPIPALSTADYHVSFQVFDLASPLGATVLVFGQGDEVQSLVPVGAGDVIANEPRQVLNDTTVTTRDLVLKISSCQVGADFGPHHRQTVKGDVTLGCTFDATYTGHDIYHDVGARNLQLKLPDGTVLSAVKPASEILDPSETARAAYVGFSFKGPAPGRYTLLVIDPHGSEVPSPSNTYEVPITI